jgi:imidazolonepropionase-like amidohydrolase
MKIAGESYESIARSGGGIRSSARALAESDDAAVLVQAEALAAEHPDLRGVDPGDLPIALMTCASAATVKR